MMRASRWFHMARGLALLAVLGAAAGLILVHRSEERSRRAAETEAQQVALFVDDVPHEELGNLLGRLNDPRIERAAPQGDAQPTPGAPAAAPAHEAEAHR